MSRTFSHTDSRAHNPLQISAHLERKGRPLALVHPMQLLARSIEGGTSRRRRLPLPGR